MIKIEKDTSHDNSQEFHRIAASRVDLDRKLSQAIEGQSNNDKKSSKKISIFILKLTLTGDDCNCGCGLRKLIKMSKIHLKLLLDSPDVVDLCAVQSTKIHR